MNIFIFGGTGDLASRKLLPALYRHFKAHRLSAQAKIVSIGSRAINSSEYQILVRENLEHHLNESEFDENVCSEFLKLISFLKIDFNKADTFKLLANNALDGRRNIYYLAVSPYFL